MRSSWKILPPLKNGVRILSLPDEKLLRFGMCVAFATGSRHEPADRSGFTHVLEHVMSSETFRFPVSRMLNRALDERTRGFDPSISRAVLCFTLIGKRSRMDQCLEILAEVTMRPRFRRSVLAAEISQIAGENRDPDNFTNYLGFLSDELAYHGNGLGQPIDPDPRQLAGINVGKLRQWHRQVVVGRRTVIVLTGNFDPERLVPLVQKRFARLPAGNPALIDQFRSTQRRLRLKLIEAPTSLIHLSISWPVCGFGSASRYPLAILNNHLGDTDRYGSRLADRLKAEFGHAYWVRSGVYHYQDAGTFNLQTATEPDRLPAVLGIINQELSQLRIQLISTSDFRLAQTRLKDGARDRNHQPGELAEFYAGQFLSTGDLVTSEQYVRTINRVTTRQVRRVARQMLGSNRMNVILAGPVKGLDEREVRRALRLTD